MADASIFASARYVLGGCVPLMSAWGGNTPQLTSRRTVAATDVTDMQMYS